MIDLSNLSQNERKGLQNTLNKNLYGHKRTVDVLTKIGQPFSVNGRAHDTYPGWMGQDLGKFRPEGRSITIQDVYTKSFTARLQDFDASWSMPRWSIQASEPFANVVQELQENLFPIIADTLLAGLTEYITENPHKWEVLDPNTNLTGYDGQVAYSNLHDGNTDNLISGTNTTPAGIKYDVYQGINALLSAKIPGTNRYYWAGLNIDDCELVIMHPVALNEVMRDTFTTDTWPAFISLNSYNAPIDNVLSKMNKGGRPQLIANPFLDEISTQDWYVFLTSKAISPSSQAFVYWFNTNQTMTPNSSEQLRKGSEIVIGQAQGDPTANPPTKSGGIFTVEMLGPGSDSWVRNNVAVISAKSTWVPFIANYYRTFKVAF